MTAIRVATGDSSYDVVVGPLSAAANRLQALLDGRRLTVATDQRVLELHGGKLAALANCDFVTVPAGEAAKSWAALEGLIDRLAALGLARGSPLAAFGGGSIGDVAGLAAALFKRGCPVIHIPTTLLAQADSAIGGKTAIDAAGQKNLVGAFHPPALVLADPTFLSTLDRRQLNSGYAEVAKYGLISEPAFFAWCEDHGAAVVDGDGDAQVEAVTHSIAAKARVVADDPFDRSGRRALLNLGHSFGHAIEALTGHGKVLHGEAVATGMSLAFRFSEWTRLCPAEDRERVAAHLSSVGLPTTLAEVGLAGRGSELLPLMLKDKKADGSGKATLILVRGIGRAFLARDIEPAAIGEFLAGAD